MKMLVLIRNNLKIDKRIRNNVSALAEHMDSIHVVARPVPDDTFHLSHPKVTHSFFKYRATESDLCNRIKRFAEERKLFAQLARAFPLIRTTDYYDATAIAQSKRYLDILMRSERWHEIRNRKSEPMEDHIAVSYPLAFYDTSMQWALEAEAIEADIVYCSGLDTLLCGVVHKQKHGSRLIYDARDIFCDLAAYVFPQYYSNVLALFEQQFIQYVDLVITTSDGHASWMKKHFGCRCPILTIHNCVSADLDAIKPKAYTGGPIKLYFHGLSDAPKKIDVMVKAISRVPGIELVLRCVASENLLAVKKLVNDLGVSHKVHFLDLVTPEEVAFYANRDGDLGIHIWETENCVNTLRALTNKFIEYLSAGLPVITSPLIAQANIVNRYDCGYILKDNSVDNLVDVLESILAHGHQELAVKSENALAAAKQYFDWHYYREVLIQAVLNNQHVINRLSLRKLPKESRKKCKKWEREDKKAYKLYRKALRAYEKSTQPEAGRLGLGRPQSPETNIRSRLFGNLAAWRKR